MIPTPSTIILAFNILDPQPYISMFGLVGIFVILFVETGLLAGFFLPGDSMLFLAGVLTAASATSDAATLPLPALLIGCPVAAALGAQLGYALGVAAGRRAGSGARRRRLDQAERWFVRFGPTTAVLLARFVGIVRTFINPAAGILGMPVRRFALANVVGAIVWTDGLLLLGRTVGVTVPQVRDHLELVVLAVVVLATVPGLIGLRRALPPRRASSARSTTGRTHGTAR